MSLSADHYDSFVVRIRSRNGVFIQGEITCIATKEGMQFKDLQRILTFILEHLGPHSEPRPGKEDAG